MLEIIEATSPYRTREPAEVESMSENESGVALIQRFISDHKLRSHGIPCAPRVKKMIHGGSDIVSCLFTFGNELRRKSI